MRDRIFEIIEVNKDDDKASTAYDTVMMIVIIASLVPLAFKSTNSVFKVIDLISTIIFIADYALRLFTADKKLEIKGTAAFFIYPLTPMAIIDLLVILSSFSFISNGFKVLKMLRLARTLRILRAAKFLRYSKNLIIILNVLKKERRALSAVATLAVAYILVSALVIFNVEPDSFNNFFDAIYWATVSLTTVGYGDIYPTSTLGRIVTMLSSIFGIAIIALPSGIITGGYLTEINNYKDNSNT
ncbi:ion transporter [uncultured Ruminococcus sp.]|uniref:ion transporter n=1 Tax=uncultured Ruminococcus sp. TaxID=165186 RepID=UPI0025CCDAC7|nr:ion transporter [uncultured Ruminococcus sp.]